MILLKSRYDVRFLALIPPVGINFMLTYGAAMALIFASPPDCSAGKNFTTSSPSSIACSMSEGLEVPGVMGTFFSRQYFTVLGFKPGLTMNLAPAAIAASTCSAFNTVPAPTHMSGNCVVMILIASAAALVRKVTSAQGSPPAHNAFARGAASSALSILTTGTMPILLICSNIGFIFSSLRQYFLYRCGNLITLAVSGKIFLEFRT